MKERNPGIDLLRMLSMFMILVLHILGQGGILETAPPLSAKYNIAWLLEIASYCAVNCYALLTGYVSAESKFRYSRIVVLWLRVVFYTLLITIVFRIIMPEAVGLKAFINALLPVMKNQYWYFTSYFGLFFFIPFMNALIHALDKGRFRLLTITLLIVFSLLPTLTPVDVFRLYGGYSLIWLAVMYFIGAYIKIYGAGREHSKAVYFICYLVSIFCVWFSKLILTYLGFNGNVLIDYTSPFIVLSAVSLLLFFTRLNIRGKIPRALINALAPASFSVYLIHAHPFTWEWVMRLRFAYFLSYGTFAFTALVIASAAAIFLACSLFDYLRIGIFKIIKLNSVVGKIEDKIRNSKLLNQKALSDLKK